MCLGTNIRCAGGRGSNMIYSKLSAFRPSQGPSTQAGPRCFNVSPSVECVLCTVYSVLCTLYAVHSTTPLVTLSPKIAPRGLNLAWIVGEVSGPDPPAGLHTRSRKNETRADGFSLTSAAYKLVLWGRRAGKVTHKKNAGVMRGFGAGYLPPGQSSPISL